LHRAAKPPAPSFSSSSPLRAITDRRRRNSSGIVEARGAISPFRHAGSTRGFFCCSAGSIGKPVVGLCRSRRGSPKSNGFDFVLQRLFAGMARDGGGF